MRKNIVIVLLLVLFSNSGYSQLSFGVSPGFNLNTAYFGYKINSKIMPFIGFQYLNTSSSTDESYYQYDYSGGIGGYVLKNRTSETNLSLLIPNIGLKCFFIQRDKIQAYGIISLTKPFIFGSDFTNGTENKGYKENLDKISLIGGQLGFGMELFHKLEFYLAE